VDFEITEEQKQINALIKEFCEREIDEKRMAELAEKAATAKTVEELRNLQPLDLMEKCHEVGLRQLCIPEEYGGGGFTHASNVTRAIAGEQAGYYGGLGAHVMVVPWQHCQIIATGNATREQLDWYFKRYMEDPHLEYHVTGSEPEESVTIHTGQDVPGGTMKVLARKDGDEWVINGDKLFSTLGGVVDLNLCFARTEEGPIKESMTAFLIQTDTPGISYTLNRLVSQGTQGNAQTSYDNVRVPDSQRVGEVNRGYYVLERLMAGHLAMMAGSIARMQKLYEQIRDYAKERIAGGKPVIQHTHIDAILGEVAASLEAQRAFTYKGCWEMDQQEKAGKPVSLFWAQAAVYLRKDLSWRLAQAAHAVYGGMVGSLDLPFEGFLRGMYGSLCAGTPHPMNAIRSSWYYDDRYR